MEQKTKKETWNTYVELQQLLHEVYRALFGMPKKDRVVLGDRIMSAATDALTYYNLAYKFMESCMRADPARHCNIYVPLDRWDAIPDSKSLFHKPTGTGGAIGFLCWQNAMGLYINEVVKWLASHDFMRVMVFVDDIYMVTKNKDITLAIMPELRRRLAELKVSLNERKFYCQHYSKGIMCLGTMLKFDRAYVNNTTSKRAFKSLSDWKGKVLHGLDRQRLLCSLNTYCGIFKKRNNRKELLSFIGSGLKMFRKKLVLNGKKNCFNLKKGRKTWSNSP